MSRERTHALLVHPRFEGESFWNYRDACEIIGAKYPSAPLGLITVAAMLPDAWEVRLVDRNVNVLDDADLEWADLVMIGSMLPQAFDALRLLRLCRDRGVPVVVGGPDPTSRPEIYALADFAVLGEAEGAIDAFLEDWRGGAVSGVYTAPKFTIDVTKTPAPRYELLDFKNYIYIGVQFSRGCPFMCEFCDIIELYGRKPRAKETGQLLAELDRLYNLGYRGHVDFVDDNLIGNKKAVKLFLPHLIAWQKERGYPFEFSTEASLNLADDSELLRLLSEARFFVVFIGIESPDDDVLNATRKKQNSKRDIAENVRTIYGYGIVVIGGFIVGFDAEKANVAQATANLIEAATIPVAMVGLLYALPNTQLSRRLTVEGRLHQLQFTPDDGLPPGDQCTAGLNFETSRPRGEILADYRDIVRVAYTPKAFFGRIQRMGLALKTRPTRSALDPRRAIKDLRRFFRVAWALSFVTPGSFGPFWIAFAAIVLRNPTAIKSAMNLAALYIHLGPFSAFVIREIEARIEEIKAGTAPPLLVAPDALSESAALPETYRHATNG